MKAAIKYGLVFFAIGTLAFGASAQVKKTQRPGTSAAATPSPTPSPEPTPAGTKKNERPTEAAKQAAGAEKDYKPTYFYEFSRPGFDTSHVLLEHDVTGKGKVSFLQKDFSEMMTDPVQLTPATLKGINETLERMDFLGSTENYQYEKDMPQMGNVVFRYVRDGRERTVKFNWTTNKDAKFLMDEYRRLTNEATWKFELAMSRQNQPLETPRMLDMLDTYLRMNEISDPPHLIPLLKELNNDERLPLIARNHSTRLIERIEKAKK